MTMHYVYSIHTQIFTYKIKYDLPLYIGRCLWADIWR